MTASHKNLGLLLARSAALLLALSALTWFVVRAQWSASQRAVSAAPASATTNAAATSPPEAYLSTSKSIVLRPVESRPAAPASPTYLFSSKAGPVPTSASREEK